MKQDTSIFWYDYPLDVEIIEAGDFYHDPSLPLDQPTYQYASVSVDASLPTEIESTQEIIDPVSEQPIIKTVVKPLRTLVEEELFIPDDGSFMASQRNQNLNQEFINDLVYEAYRITDNLDDLPNGVENGRSDALNWRPGGQIRVWDDKLNSWVGVQGIDVRARRWFTTHPGRTNANGEYVCKGTFLNPANYSIRWERYDYSIRSGSIGQAWLNGPKKEGNWNHDIADNTLQQFYAFTHLGAREYYYGNRLGLKKPPQNAFFKPQMKIGCYDESGRANHNDDKRLLGIRNQVRMYRKYTYQGTTYIDDCEGIYSTIIHELAHASHWELRKGDWDGGTSDRLQESWAVGVARELTRLRYTGHSSWLEYATFEDIKTDGESKYTALIIDLIDTYNQGNFVSTRPFDRVQGYTISQIESVLANCSNLADLRDRLKSKYDNQSEAYFDELFNQYISLSR